MRKEILRADKITCESDGVRYLDMYNLHVMSGEIMGIFFVDHHGKQAFIDVVTENRPLDYGDLFFRDKLVNTWLTARPRANRRVALIHPEITPVEGMSVADNVFVLRKNFRKYLIHSSVLESQFRQLAEEYGVRMDGHRKAGDLSAADRYILQLLKAAVTGHSLIILCDIAVSVEPGQLLKVHDFIRCLAARGVAFLYIENQIRSILSLCDKLALVEKGRVLQTLDQKDFRDETFRRYLYSAPAQKNSGAMSAPAYRDGDAPASAYRDGDAPAPAPRHGRGREGGTIFQMKDLVFKHLCGVSFTMTEGECILFWDQSDTALQDMVSLITGESVPEAGQIILSDRRRRRGGLKKPVPIGVIDQSPDRTMVFPDMSVLDNLCFLAGRRNPNIWMRGALRRNIRREYGPLLGPEIDAPDASALSREFLYKLVYYSYEIYSPRLLVIVQPFRETSRKTQAHILSILKDMQKRGTALLILDVNTTESGAIADRTLVLNRGRIVSEMKNQEAVR